MTVTAARSDPVQERQAAYDALATRDDALARLVLRYGTPDPFFWGVLEGAAGGDAFAELSLHIVSQQISTAAALTIFKRLRDELGGQIQPAAIISVPAKGCGRWACRALRAR
jgi:3-methyladenine DNA glycosylase/8-oxoguanine DNA glycosylase